MPYLKRAGQPDIHYLVDDYTDPWRDAPYLVLQHGNGRSARFWYSWVPYLSRFYKVVRPDVRGLGLSSSEFDLEKHFTMDACVADLLAIVDDLGAKSVHVCGESMGGIISVAFAGMHPQRVRTLTLVSTPVFIEERAKKNNALGHDTRADAINKIGMKAWVEATNSSMRFPPDTDAGLLDWYKEEFVRNRPEAQLAMTGLLNRTNAAIYLDKVEAPVLGLYPDSGPVTSAEQEKLLAASIGDLRMVHLPTSFHKVQMIFPAACANHLLHFISRHDGIACHEH